MSLNLMYITNNPKIAKIAENSGVDRIFVDLEYIGKEERQAGLDTVKSFHTIEDVKNIKQVLNKAKLLVRINPIHDVSNDYCSTEEEVEQVIAAGADIIMLPMFKTVDEVVRFLKAVNGRVKTMLLLETSEAANNIKEIISVSGIDEIHIGLNDLHLAFKKKFMFELLTDGTVERLCKEISTKNIPYGFGGIARLGYGELPAEYIIAEHYRLGSTFAILSRSFCNANKLLNNENVDYIFENGIKLIRDYEKKVILFTNNDFERIKLQIDEKVKEIVKGKVNCEK